MRMVNERVLRRSSELALTMLIRIDLQRDNHSEKHGERTIEHRLAAGYTGLKRSNVV